MKLIFGARAASQCVHTLLLFGAELVVIGMDTDRESLAGPGRFPVIGLQVGPSPHLPPDVKGFGKSGGVERSLVPPTAIPSRHLTGFPDTLAATGGCGTPTGQ